MVINVLSAAIPFIEGIIKVFIRSEFGSIGAREDVSPFNVIWNTSGYTVNGKIGLVLLIYYQKQEQKTFQPYTQSRDFTCTIDSDVNSARYIVPGLGETHPKLDTVLFLIKRDFIN